MRCFQMTKECSPGALCFTARWKQPALLNAGAPSATSRAGERQHRSTAFPMELLLLPLEPSTSESLQRFTLPCCCGAPVLLPGWRTWFCCCCLDAAGLRWLHRFQNQ